MINKLLRFFVFLFKAQRIIIFGKLILNILLYKFFFVILISYMYFILFIQGIAKAFIFLIFLKFVLNNFSLFLNRIQEIGS